MNDIRWKQRYENLSKAYSKLNMALDAVNKDSKNELMHMALIQAFEFTYELCWKTIKDYLKFQGLELSLPREVLKQAFASNIIKDGQVWINMLEDRNLMAHTYDQNRANTAVCKIINEYYPAIKQLYTYFESKL